MKQKIQTGLILAMIFLSAITFGQTNEPESEKTNDSKKIRKNLPGPNG